MSVEVHWYKLTAPPPRETDLDVMPLRLSRPDDPPQLIVGAEIASWSNRGRVGERLLELIQVLERSLERRLNVAVPLNFGCLAAPSDLDALAAYLERWPHVYARTKVGRQVREDLATLRQLFSQHEAIAVQGGW